MFPHKGESWTTGTESLDASQIRASVLRISASPPFVQSLRMQQFLHFIVETTLEGNRDRLKETIVGIEVFRRSPGYDPKSDSVVRTEARRLRTKLEQYYSTTGKLDCVVIHLHKGTYVPVFEVLAETSSSRLTEEAGATEPFSDTSNPAKTVQITPLTKSKNRLTIAFSVATIGLLLAAVYWNRFFRSETPLPIRVTPLTGNAGTEMDPAFSPDGRQIAYAWRKDGGEFDIYVKLVDLGDPVRLTRNSGHNVNPRWSPDGQRIAFLRATPAHTEIVVIPALGGSEHVIFTFQGGFDHWAPYGPQNSGKSGPAWSEDGEAVFVCDARNDAECELIRANVNGGMTLITKPERGELDFSPAVSPDGKSLAFVRGIPGAGDVYVVSTNGGSVRRLTTDNRDISGLTWWDNHKVLFGSSRGGTMELWETELSAPTPVTVPFISGFNGEYPAASETSRLIAYVNAVEQQSIWRRSLVAGTPLPPAERFISSARSDHSPQYSPNGTQIAFVSNRSGAWEIWSCNSDGSRPIRLTNFGGAPVGSPHWSPDSRSLVLDAKIGHFSGIWTVDIAAGTSPRPINTVQHDEMIPNWSKDGQWIYFVSDIAGKNHLWKQNVASGNIILVTNDVALDATESDDAKYLYFEKAKGSIWRKPINGGVAVVIPEMATLRTNRNWARTPKGIYFATRTETQPLLGFLPFGAHSITRLGAMEGDIIDGTPSFAVSPDEEWILYAQRETIRSTIMIAHHVSLNQRVSDAALTHE